MTAQIQFFCSAREERMVLDDLADDVAVAVFLLDGERMQELPEFSPNELPNWPDSVCLYLWATAFGPLRWYDKRPNVGGLTHGSLVASLFAQEHWDESAAVEGDRLLDQDTSPGMCYKRAEFIDGRTGPCTLIVPPSNLERVGPEYAKWVNQCISWIRRRGKKVHDWRSPSEVIPNKFGFLNSICAFPDALAQIETGVHSFAIS